MAGILLFVGRTREPASPFGGDFLVTFSSSGQSCCTSPLTKHPRSAWPRSKDSSLPQKILSGTSRKKMATNEYCPPEFFARLNNTRLPRVDLRIAKVRTNDFAAPDLPLARTTTRFYRAVSVPGGARASLRSARRARPWPNDEPPFHPSVSDAMNPICTLSRLPHNDIPQERRLEEDHIARRRTPAGSFARTRAIDRLPPPALRSIGCARCA